MIINANLTSVGGKSKSQRKSNKVKDLTSFTGGQTNPQRSSSEVRAVKNRTQLPKHNGFLNNISFKGRMTKGAVYRGTSGGMSVSGEGVPSELHKKPEYSGADLKSEQLMTEISRSDSHHYPNTMSVNIYVADTGEDISDAIKKEAHFIVTDETKPGVYQFEDLKKLYLYDGQKDEPYCNNPKHPKEIAVREGEYYGRLEKGAKNRLADAEHFHGESKAKLEESLAHQKRYQDEIDKFPWREPKLAEAKSEADYFVAEHQKKTTAGWEKVAKYRAEVQQAQQKQGVSVGMFKLLQEATGDVEAKHLKVELLRSANREKDYNTRLAEQGKERNKELSETLKRKEEELSVVKQMRKVKETNIEKDELERTKREELQKEIKKIKVEEEQRAKEIETIKSKITHNEGKIRECEVEAKKYSEALPGLKKDIGEAVERVKKHLPRIEEYYKKHYRHLIKSV